MLLYEIWKKWKAVIASYFNVILALHVVFFSVAPKTTHKVQQSIQPYNWTYLC